MEDRQDGIIDAKQVLSEVSSLQNWTETAVSCRYVGWSMSGCAQLKGFWVAADRASQLFQLPCQLFVYLSSSSALWETSLGLEISYFTSSRRLHLIIVSKYTPKTSWLWTKYSYLCPLVHLVNFYLRPPLVSQASPFLGGICCHGV